jgi:hypothetical protein
MGSSLCTAMIHVCMLHYLIVGLCGYKIEIDSCVHETGGGILLISP